MTQFHISLCDEDSIRSVLKRAVVSSVFPSISEILHDEQIDSKDINLDDVSTYGLIVLLKLAHGVISWKQLKII